MLHPEFPEYRVLGLPRGALLGALGTGQNFAFTVVDYGLVHVGIGRYREIPIMLDEERLGPDEAGGKPA